MGKKAQPSKLLPKDSRTVKPVSPLHSPINVSFRYYSAGNNHCLSLAERNEVRQCMDCIRILTTMTWEQVRNQGGKPGNKTGLGYTTYEDHELKATRPSQLSEDVSISGIRASDTIRIFGANIGNVFHVLWFDRTHSIWTGKPKK